MYFGVSQYEATFNKCFKPFPKTFLISPWKKWHWRWEKQHHTARNHSLDGKTVEHFFLQVIMNVCCHCWWCRICDYPCVNVSVFLDAHACCTWQKSCQAAASNIWNSDRQSKCLSEEYIEARGTEHFAAADWFSSLTAEQTVADQLHKDRKGAWKGLISNYEWMCFMFWRDVGLSVHVRQYTDNTVLYCVICIV